MSAPDPLNKALFVCNPADYRKTDYAEHLMDQYKLYVEMADRVSQRRQAANSFFLSINTGIIAVVGYLLNTAAHDGFHRFYWLPSIAGLLLCFAWYRLIRSYKGLNTAKFKIIHEIEKRLPISPYDAEWEIAGRGEDKKLYLPFTHIEIVVPWFFFATHLVVIAAAIPVCRLIKAILC